MDTVTTAKKQSKNSNYPPSKISWEDFQRKYLEREDAFKYEWVNGYVEKTTRSMDKTQFYILDNLEKLFDALKQSGKVKGRLISEGDTFFQQNHRRPDIAFYTPEQIQLARDERNEVIPQFVIEVISKKDQMNLVHLKMKDYRAAGVQVVWHIFPKLQEVHIYHSQNLEQMTICEGAKICSAAPVIPEFQLAAKDIFV